MVQQTSLEAYAIVTRDLPRRQLEVYRFFEKYSNFDFTNMEAAHFLGWSINRVTPRVHELRQKGLLAYSQTRRCMITKNKAMAWKVR